MGIWLMKMLQMHFQLSSQPSFVNLSFIKGQKKQAGGTWKISTACNPIEDRTGGAAGDEGQILVADVVAVEEGLQVLHFDVPCVCRRRCHPAAVSYLL